MGNRSTSPDGARVSDPDIRRMITQRNTVSSVSDTEILESLQQREYEWTAELLYELMDEKRRTNINSEAVNLVERLCRVCIEHRDLMELLEP